MGNQRGPPLLSWAVLTKRNMKSCGFSCFCLQPCCPSPLPWLGWKVMERSLLLPLLPSPPDDSPVLQHLWALVRTGDLAQVDGTVRCLSHADALA